MIHITPEAAQYICTLIAEKQTTQTQPREGLRLSIEKGGCAGLQYVMTLGMAEPGDLILSHDEARVFVDAHSVDSLEGCKLDYESGLTGSGFRIINPQAARSCGCGTSFEPKGKK